MNEIEFAKYLRDVYDKNIELDNDFVNLVGNTSEYDELDYNKIKVECAKLNIKFMSCNEALKLCKTEQARKAYSNEPNKYIFFDPRDKDKGID